MNAFNTVFALLAGWDPALTTAPADAAGIALAFSEGKELLGAY